jgi:hypothetical protein
VLFERLLMLSRRASFPFFLLLLITGFVLCCGPLLYPSVHARYLLHKLQSIQINHSTFEDAQRFAKEVGATPLGECTHIECRWYRFTDNALLPRWYRGRGVNFTIIFTVKDAIVTDKGVEYSIGLGPFTAEEAFVGRPRVDVYESESWFTWQAEKRRELHKKSPDKFPDYVEPPVDKGWQKIWYDATGNVAVDYYAVVISPRSTTIPEDWKKYTAFNYSCFWKYRGCGYGKDLLPRTGPYPPHPSS